MESTMENEDISLDDALSATYDEVMARTDEGGEEPPVAQEPPANEPEAEADAAEEAQEEESVEGGQGGEVQDKAPIDPPSSMKAEYKEAFAKLPPDMQKFIVERDSETNANYTQSKQELAQEKQRLGEINDLLEPFGRKMAEYGIPTSAALGQLLQLRDFAESDPKGYIEWFAEQRGIPLSNPQTGEGDEYTDPDVVALKTQVSELKAQLNNAIHEARTQPVLSEAQRVIEQFRSDGDKYPYFADVEASLQPFVQSLQRTQPQLSMADTLKTAYEQAIWANADVKTRMLQAERDKEGAKAAEVAKKAKRAAQATPVKGVPSNAKAAVGSIDDTLNATWDRIMGAM